MFNRIDTLITDKTRSFLDDGDIFYTINWLNGKSVMCVFDDESFTKIVSKAF